MAGKHRATVEEEQQQAFAAGQQSAVASAAAVPAPARALSAGVSADDVARLQQLGQLHEQGVLSDEEFSQQKALILATR